MIYKWRLLTSDRTIIQKGKVNADSQGGALQELHDRNIHPYNGERLEIIESPLFSEGMCSKVLT